MSDPKFNPFNEKGKPKSNDDPFTTFDKVLRRYHITRKYLLRKAELFHKLHAEYGDQILHHCWLCPYSRWGAPCRVRDWQEELVKVGLDMRAECLLKYLPKI